MAFMWGTTVSAASGFTASFGLGGQCMTGKHESLVLGRVWSRPSRKVTLLGAISLMLALIAGAALAAPSWAAGPAGAPVEGTPCTASARACVDLGGPQQAAPQAWLIENGKISYGPVGISTGVDADPSKRTHPGTFHVFWKHQHHVSTISKTPDFPKGVPMEWSVFFDGDIAFHEGSLADESLGCIHLEPAAAETFFTTLHVGDEVQVKNPRVS